MNEQFVTYTQAKRLKKLGFKNPCLASYKHAGKKLVLGEFINHGEYSILAPLKQQAIKALIAKLPYCRFSYFHDLKGHILPQRGVPLYCESAEMAINILLNLVEQHENNSENR